MFDKTHNDMNNWRWDNPHAFRDQVDHYNLMITSLGKVKHTGVRFSWYGRDDLRAKIEPPSCRQYKQGDYLAIRQPNWADIMDQDDDDDENWADPAGPSGRRSRPGNGHDNNNREVEENTQGGEKGTKNGKGTKDRNGEWEGECNGVREGEDTQ
jgi:hypothetical protein